MIYKFVMELISTLGLNELADIIQPRQYIVMLAS